MLCGGAGESCTKCKAEQPSNGLERGCDRMSELRAYTKNGGKIIDLLIEQTERRKEKGLSEEEKEVKQEVWKDRQAGDTRSWARRKRLFSV